MVLRDSFSISRTLSCSSERALSRLDSSSNSASPVETNCIGIYHTSDRKVIAPRFNDGLDGDPSVRQLEEVGAARCPSALVSVENTHNTQGGTVAAPPALAALYALAAAQGVPVHTDGARLFNAAVALGLPLHQLAEHTNSLTVCLSKGLSAPVGSVLMGSTAFIQRARNIRRMLGGTMRQAGVLAAAGLVALEHMVDRLTEDHQRARALYRGLQAMNATWCGPDQPQTNIVRVRVGASAADGQLWEQQLAGHGVLVRASAAGSLRLVTHRHIDDAAVVATLRVFETVLKSKH